MGKMKDCPIYDQLLMIFADSGADGKYAQSSHYEELDKSVSSLDPSCLEGDAENMHPQTPHASKIIEEITYSPQNTMKNIAERKRKRPAESVSEPTESNLDQKLRDNMAQTMFEMIAASKLQTVTTSKYDERFTITNCIKALDELEGIEDWLYYSALDLFENPSLREIFLSLQSSLIRLTWLRGKCGQSYPIV